MNSLSNLWQKLTLPTHLAAGSATYKSQFLAASLIIICVLGSLSVIAQSIYLANFNATYYSVLGAIAVLCIAYWLNRQGKYRIAAIITCVVPVISCFLAIANNPAELFAFSYLLLGIMLSGFLLSFNDAVKLWLVTIAGLILLQVIIPERVPGGDFVVAPMFLVIMGGLVLLTIKQRDLIDQMRMRQTRIDKRNLEIAQEIAKCGSWVWNVENNQFTVSEALPNIYGVPFQKFEEAPWAILYHFTHPDEKNTVRDTVEKAVEAKKEFNFEYRIVKESGEERTLWVKGEPLIAPGAREYFGIIQDITDHKKIEQALKASEEKWRSMAQNSPDHVMLVDLDKRIQYINFLAPQYTLDDVIGTKVFDFVAEDYRQVMRDCFDRVEAKKISDRFDVPLIEPDGNLRFYEAYVSPVLHEGKVAEFILSARDITDRRHAEETIRQSQEELSAILSSMQDTYYRTDTEGKLVRISGGVSDLLGYPPGELIGTRLSDLYVDPNGREKFLKALKEANGRLNNYEAPLRHKDGRDIWVSTNAHMIFDENKQLLGVEGTTRDITQKKQTEMQMVKLSRALEQSADAVLITDKEGVVEYINPGFEVTTGYSFSELIGKTPAVLNSGKMSTEFYKQLWDTISRGDAFSDVFINKKRDGTIFYEQKTISPLKNPEGEITHYVATGKDITEYVQSQKRIQFLAHHDVLTELPNRALFTDRLIHAVNQAKRKDTLLALLFLDLDRFKNINDSLGHEVGDKLLQVLAKRLEDCVREGDTVARIGGDEFAILLEDLSELGQISAFANKILDFLSPAVRINGRDLFITASIGISIYPSDAEEPETLLRNSDIAMYRAKDLGKNNFQFYSSELSVRMLERINLENNLRHALDKKQFMLYYQPQIDLQSGRTVGVEALLRWHHPEFGVVMPADFIFLLEETGLIQSVGEWVLQQACYQLKQWHEKGYDQLTMAVNFSSRQCQDTSIAEIVKQTVKSAGVNPAYLGLEITESLLMRNVRFVDEVLEAFTQLGIQLAIDDFGTGYSSLSYLKRFPISILKIDRSFTMDIFREGVENQDDTEIVKAIIAMGKTLNLKVIAEGVETQEQMQFLKDQKCDSVQGYLFSKPVSLEEMEMWLAAHY